MEKTEALSLGWPVRAISSRIVAEFRDWPLWWSELSISRKILPGLLIAGYWLGLVALGGFRGDHIGLGSMVLALYYGGRFADQLRQFTMPFLLTGILYEIGRAHV